MLAVVAGTRTKHTSSDPGGFVIRRRPEACRFDFTCSTRGAAGSPRV